ncbi:hypothetical protein [Bradyrhizobium erythrophlei]|uniref:Uncharacterized protein n=1 Tax=Bradyrhizobium erythrophlei TaxID=1437360 RepID=A0A1M7UJG7_9BRAD|nr:hypothetical protein [Bradyrhizobium erythrophlei]SHN83152.1 hypothetical protein SAMN05444170_5416 [Bradyrhizobium erythrophlei]
MIDVTLPQLLEKHACHVIPGCAARRRPGIHGTARIGGAMDSGLALARAPE